MQQTCVVTLPGRRKLRPDPEGSRTLTMTVGDVKTPPRQHLPLTVFGHLTVSASDARPRLPVSGYASACMRRKFRIIEPHSTLVSRFEPTGIFYMYIPPSPMLPRRPLVSDWFCNSVSPCQWQGAGTRTPENSTRHACTCRIILSDQKERFTSSETCREDEISFPRGNGMCREGRRISIASI